MSGPPWPDQSVLGGAMHLLRADMENTILGSDDFLDSWLGPVAKDARPLTIPSVRLLFDLADWRVILCDGNIDREYGTSTSVFSTISLFKMLTLPYLIGIPTERGLTRQVEENEDLLLLCGFWPKEPIPSRGTIWNFRKKYAEFFPGVMLRILVSIALSQNDRMYDLPFVERVFTVGQPPAASTRFSTCVTMAPRLKYGEQ